MKPTNRNSAMAVALFLLLWTVQPVSAFYAPNVQRWVTRDPIGEQGGHNLYQFAGSSPVCEIDSFGREIFCSSSRICTPAEKKKCEAICAKKTPPQVPYFCRIDRTTVKIPGTIFTTPGSVWVDTMNCQCWQLDFGPTPRRKK